MASGVKITTEEIRYIALFESMTGAITKDCVIDEDENRLIFIVKSGNVGRAIGKRGTNIKRVREIIGKGIDVVELANTPEQFIKNILAPAHVKSIHISEKMDGRKIAVVNVSSQDRGLAIGKNGRNVSKARILAARYFDISDVVIA